MRDLVAETRLRVDRPRRPAVRPRGHRRTAADRVAARRRAAHAREPAQGGRRARPTSACGAVDPVRRAGAQGRRRLAAPSTPTASCSWRCADLRGDVGDDVVLMADLCVDEYTDHGHCGVLDERRHASTTTPRSRSTPGPRVAQAAAGAARRRAERDDGRPGRRASAPRSTPPGFADVAILAYSAKYASGAVRAVPRRGRRADRRRRRPQGLPAGLAQRPRGAASRSTPTSPRAPTW